MPSGEDAAAANAIIRRDGNPKLSNGSDCPKCHKTTLSVSLDEHNAPEHAPTCPNCGFVAASK